MATTKITNPELFDLGSLDSALKLPSGTTAERPTSPSTGEWRYNTDNNLIEFWDGGAWRDLQDEEIPPVPSENFNTVLYTGNSSTQSITGVGFEPDWVWIKERGPAAENHNLTDSSRGTNKILNSNNTSAEITSTTRITSFDSDGFTLGSNNETNDSGSTYVAWCWKANGGTTSSNTDGTETSTVQVNSKAGFSIIQWTSTTATSSTTVGHGLGTTPAMIIVKRTDAVEDWYIWHKELGGGGSGALNKFLRFNTNAQATATNLFNTVNSTVFNPTYTSAPNTNIGYCFAEKAGYSKFGTYTGNGSDNGPIINTGFEPAFVMTKQTNTVSNWVIVDNKRSTTNPRDKGLRPNSDATEASVSNNMVVDFLSNGFQLKQTGGANDNGGTFIYMAFASDPSPAPVLADSFNANLYTGNGTSQSVTGVGFSPNLVFLKMRNNPSSYISRVIDSVRGVTKEIYPESSLAENTETAGVLSLDADGFTLGTNAAYNNNGTNFVSWNWKANPIPTINTDGTVQSVVSANQASGFSIVSFKTPATNNFTVGHGLSDAPKLMIIKGTSIVSSWTVYSSEIGATNYLQLNTTNGSTASSLPFNDTAPTSSVFTLGSSTVWYGTNESYIAYCFSEVAGFSKFGSYTGNGSSTGPVVTTGFQPDFIILKSSSYSPTQWVLMDSVRDNSVDFSAILFANASNAETDGITRAETSSTGFQITTASNSYNRNGETYIYMAFKNNPVQYPIASGEMAFLVVAGGGGGGQIGAGGGAGGLRTSYGPTSGGGASAESNITLAAGTYTITVGSGGPAIAGSGNANGSDSSIAATSITTITSTGGGMSGKYDGTAYIAGSSGGSGGGGTIGTGGSTAWQPGSGTAGQGFAGGNGDTAGPPFSMGGGGGAASAGGDSAGGNEGAQGGAGLAVSITGSLTSYAGGGGGGGETNGGAGGSGGGGNGGAIGSATQQNGTANTGGGAGGCREFALSSAGGSGVVILRMNTSDYSGVTTGSPTVKTEGSETILIYTGSGTYVHS
jgi:hypothetical protein